MPTFRTEQQITEIMRSVKSRDTTPEIALRKALWAHGLRYRLHVSAIPGKPDIVFRKDRMAVFVDGDFWHGNQWRSRGYASLEAQFVGSPKAQYWVPKIHRNMRRDRLNTAKLLMDGWRVLRFWETDVKSNLQQCVDITVQSIQRGVDPTPIAAMPEQTVAVFGESLVDISSGLESAGWRISYQSESLSIADTEGVPTVSLIVLSTQDHELASRVIVSLLKGRGPVTPAMMLLQLPDLSPSRTSEVGKLVSILDDTGYSIDILQIEGHGLFLTAIMQDAESTIPTISVARPRPVVDLIQGNPKTRWVCPALPAPPFSNENTGMQQQVFQWIGEVYLNPAVTSAIHGKALSF